MTKKPPCYTCKKGDKKRDNVIETEDTIPEWYKKSKNAFSPYLAVPKVLVCKDEYNPKKKKIDKWKKSVPPSNGSRLVLKQNVNYYNTWIFYWASDGSKNFKDVKSAEEAYDKLDNKGLIKTDKDGNAEFILNCPQPYNVGGTIYPPHLHFVHLKDKKLWSIEKVETLEVHCIVSIENLKEIIEADDHIIINGMSGKKKEYEIPGSIKTTGKITDKKVLNKLLKDIGKEKDKKDELEDIDLKKVPIVVYSVKDDEETISRDIKFHLLDNGFTNIVEYNSKKSGWEHECEDNYRGKKSKKTNSSISNEMFEIEKDMMNVETLIHKDGDSINVYDHHLDDGTLKKNNKVVGIWNGSKVLSKKDNTKSKTKSKTDTESESESESEEDVQDGGKLGGLFKLLKGAKKANEAATKGKEKLDKGAEIAGELLADVGEKLDEGKEKAEELRTAAEQAKAEVEAAAEQAAAAKAEGGAAKKKAEEEAAKKKAEEEAAKKKAEEEAAAKARARAEAEAKAEEQAPAPAPAAEQATGGGMMSELNKFKRLISGGSGIDEDSLNDSIVIRGGGEKIFRGHGFTFL